MADESEVLIPPIVNTVLPSTDTLPTDQSLTTTGIDHSQIDYTAIGKASNPNWVDWTPSQSVRQPWMCSAVRHSDGDLCRKPAISGGTVCPSHGAQFPRVKDAAKARLQSMVPKALNRLEVLADQDNHLPTAMRAVEQILDRTLGPVKSGPAVAVGVSINIPRWAVDGSSEPQVLDVVAEDTQE